MRIRPPWSLSTTRRCTRARGPQSRRVPSGETHPGSRKDLQGWPRCDRSDRSRWRAALISTNPTFGVGRDARSALQATSDRTAPKTLSAEGSTTTPPETFESISPNQSTAVQQREGLSTQNSALGKEPHGRRQRMRLTGNTSYCGSHLLRRIALVPAGPPRRRFLPDRAHTWNRSSATQATARSQYGEMTATETRTQTETGLRAAGRTASAP
jgi:hypothetical protein